MNVEESGTYWQAIYKQFQKNRIGKFAWYVVLAFCFIGIYAPFFASSKPFFVEYAGTWYFPFFRYLFYSGFYTKRLDLFFNLLMFTLPAAILFLKFGKSAWVSYGGALAAASLQLLLFFYFAFIGMADPAGDPRLSKMRQDIIQKKVQESAGSSLVPVKKDQSFAFDLHYMNDYAKLNLILNYIQSKKHHERLLTYSKEYLKKNSDKPFPSLWEMEKVRLMEQKLLLNKGLKEGRDGYYQAFSTLELYLEACNSVEAAGHNSFDCSDISNAPKEEQAELKRAKNTIASYWALKERLRFLEQKEKWLSENAARMKYIFMPLIRPFHWEDDAGGDQGLNPYLPWWELTRVNRKDLFSALIFGTRISLVVGFLAVSLALMIGVPIGAYAGFYGGTFDIIVSRLLEIWESMPTFFMLLFVIAIMQTKTIFVIIAVIGFFGWTTFSRFTRGEFFKQRNLAYVEALKCLGFSNLHIMFKDILPNAIPPLLTLLPFAIMGAITSEAGLSFLGLGEEGSCSWGVLMDEGRTAFPSEAYLLWPPAIMLTVLLVAIALVGDALRDALDPKLKA